MKIEHFFNRENSSQKEISSCLGFILTNNLGGYLWLNNFPSSRYQGWFFRFEEKLFKIVEDIHPINQKEVSLLRNNFFNIQRERGALKESFFVPHLRDALIYQLNEKICFQVSFDFKEAYDNSEKDDHYEFSKKRDVLIVKMGSFFLAAKSDGFLKEVKKRIPRDYSFDQERNSPPFSRDVFIGFEVSSSKKLILAVSKTKEAALKEVNYVFGHISSLEQEKKAQLKSLSPKRKAFWSKETTLSQLCALNSLNDLLIFDPQRKIRGIYAGLPWFFQFWHRDEAISLVSVEKKLAKILFFERVLGPQQESRLAQGSFLWFLFREQGLSFSFFEKRKIKSFLKDNFQPNSDFCFEQSWMDTLERKGALEMQALKLMALRTSFNLTSDISYQKSEEELLKKVKKEFFQNGTLADSLGNFEIRPNIFLAYYIYPFLLSRLKWEKCFEIALEKLWLDWGGLASIDKNHPSFLGFHTGENPKSYHQGDSWFFINNLAALALFKVNPEKFAFYIQKILKASQEEILWQGLIGRHGELSSAFEFNVKGCLCQAWSNALFLEALKEIDF
ncbi:MAG: amylo-alpha-1,6-glucosidase [bacterium]|nr:amylo-alpha-1,6-glucosidase [bacterium]